MFVLHDVCMSLIHMIWQFFGQILVFTGTLQFYILDLSCHNSGSFHIMLVVDNIY